MEMQVIATGMHLSPEFHRTYREIEDDSFRIDFKVEMLLSADTASAISKSNWSRLLQESLLAQVGLVVTLMKLL